MKIDILYLEITNKCNYLCKHCQNNSSFKSEEILSVNEFDSILTFFIAHGLETLNLTGGEPTIHPDFPHILENAAKKNIKINLLTNGYYIDRYVDLIYEFRKNVFVQISLDGYDRDSYYEIRNNYKFNSVISNIKLLKERGIDVRIKSTLTMKNKNSYKKFIMLASQLKCPIKFNYLNPVGRGENINQLCFGFSDILAFDQMINDSEERKCIPTMEHFFPRHCSVFDYSNGIKVIKITSVGEIYPCIGFRDGYLSLGNYKRDELEKIFENMSKIKKVIFEKISNQNCSNCNGKDVCHKTCVLTCDYFKGVYE